MAKLLKGKDVAAALNAKSAQKAAALKEKGIIPVLAILRVGEKGDDISYEKGAMKRCSAAGVEVKNVVLPEDVSQEEFYQTIDDLNHDPSVHGILMFRPLPKYLDNEKARNAIAPEKDIDGCSDGSLAGVFTGNGRGFAPCTAEAAIAILEYYVPGSGKTAGNDADGKECHRYDLPHTYPEHGGNHQKGGHCHFLHGPYRNP